MATVARPYHHGNLRATLLAEAERALAEGGVQALSLRELARRSGVSHAAPRRHFPDKQALLDALAQDGFERLGRAMGEAVSGPGRPFLERFTALASAYVRFATEHAALLELMYAGKHAAAPGGALRDAADRAFAVPFAFVAAGQAAGEIVSEDPERVATVTWAALHGLAAMLNGGMLADASSLDELVAGVAERLVLGLRPREPRRGGAPS